MTMRYFHRTTLPANEVLAEADRFFSTSMEIAGRSTRAGRFRGGDGTIHISVKSEGGHYVHVTAETDQVGESEIDKMAKRFLAQVHHRADPSHAVRGAY